MTLDRLGERTDRNIIGVDVGGANLKLANLAGVTHSVAFPMWKKKDTLCVALQQALTRVTVEPPEIALTMTGELADCFETRAEGVEYIVNQVSLAIPNSKCHVYGVDGSWKSAAEAVADPWSVAASNWHALASWVTRHFATNGEWLLVDIGSTTVDLIRIANGAVATDSRTDRDRLQRRELIYTGLERTPVAAMVRSVFIEEQECPVMAERFADSIDVYLSLGLVDEEPDNCDTADGRPRTREKAMARLARMVGEDLSTLAETEIRSIASQVLESQVNLIASAVACHLSTGCKQVLFTGHGTPISKRVALQLSGECRFEYLDEVFDTGVARCAPAYAVAKLLSSSEWNDPKEEC